jgi:hypothetical protein
VLAFLDALCAALLSRDAAVVRQLLRHPLASALPAAVRDEARRVIDGEARPFAAPLNALRLYHQTAHLLGVSHDAASRLASSRIPPVPRAAQMELPLPVKVA